MRNSIPNRWKQTAKAYWIALRRLPKDARSRGMFVPLLAGAAWVLVRVAFLYNLWGGGSVADNGTGPATVGIAIVALMGGGLYIFHVSRSRTVTLSGAMSALEPPTPVAGDTPAVRTYLSDRMAILASLIVRCSNEIGLRQTKITVEQVTAIRGQLNQQLVQSSLWDKLEPQEREMSAVSAGGVTLEQLNLLVMRWEQLRLLRWVLRIDDVLEPLAHKPEGDALLLQNLSPDPKKPLVPPWDIRVERDTAQAYTLRLLAEMRQRGMLSGHWQQQTEGWAEQLRAQSVGNSRDYLLGAKTVAELDDATLQTYGNLALARCQYASHLVEQLSSAEPLVYGVAKPS